MQASALAARPTGAAARASVRRPGRPASRAATATPAATAAPSTELDVTAMAPLGDRLLVRPRAKDTKTAGGVLLTTGATEPLTDALVGTVLAVGAGVESDVAVGDAVLYLKYSTADVEIPDGDICFVAEKSVLAKLS